MKREGGNSIFSSLKVGNMFVPDEKQVSAVRLVQCELSVNNMNSLAPIDDIGAAENVFNLQLYFSFASEHGKYMTHASQICHNVFYYAILCCTLHYYRCFFSTTTG